MSLRYQLFRVLKLPGLKVCERRKRFDQETLTNTVLSLPFVCAQG
jgi:hypothetical protein